MPTNGTWIGDPTDDNYLDFSVESNWLDGIVASGNNAVITLTPADDSYVPTTNRPNSGSFDFIVPEGFTVTVSSWIEAPATIGAITNAGVVDDAELTANGYVTNSGSIVAGAGSLWVFNAAVVNTGLLDIDTMDFNDGLSGYDGSIGSGQVVTINGTVNVQNCTWNVAVGSTLTVDLPGTLDLGGGVENLAVELGLVGTCALGNDLTVYAGFSLVMGVLAGGAAPGKTIYVGDGGFASSTSAGTVTGIVNFTRL